MTTNETTDPILRLLGGLPPPIPQVAAAKRVQLRCRRALERQQRSPARTRAHTTTLSRSFNATLAVLTGVYAAAAVFEALRLAGIF